MSKEMMPAGGMRGGMTAGDAMRGRMMSEDDLYRDEEMPEESGPMTISKDALPKSFPLGTHLILAEDLGDSYRIELMDQEESPEPGEGDEYA